MQLINDFEIKVIEQRLNVKIISIKSTNPTNNTIDYVLGFEHNGIKHYISDSVFTKSETGYQRIANEIDCQFDMFKKIQEQRFSKNYASYLVETLNAKSYLMGATSKDEILYMEEESQILVERVWEAMLDYKEDNNTENLKDHYENILEVFNEKYFKEDYKRVKQAENERLMRE